MRLFLAIPLPAKVKEQLADFTAGLAALGVQGRFSPSENLHLTLAFLGECQRQEELCRILKQFKAPAFSLESSRRLGRFAQKGGDVLWLGLKENRRLRGLQEKLAGQLRQAGFPLEERPYRPHITLARQIRIFDEDLFSDLQNRAPWFKVEAERICLMESCPGEGRRIYQERFGIELR